MKEEEAVFVLGKKFSFARNEGENLPTARVRVGSSMVLPEELADEYDKHFPPGPRKHKQETNRVLKYELTVVLDEERRPVENGLRFFLEGRPINVLANHAIFYGVSGSEYQTRICTNNSNRYDLIQGDRITFVIDKLEEKMSVKQAVFNCRDVECKEVPVMGRLTTWLRIEDYGSFDPVYFPFVPFDAFWKTWSWYVDQRSKQIEQFRNIPLPSFPPEIFIQ